MKFGTKLKVESVPGKVKWFLLDHLKFTARDGREFRAKKGSDTDFFSIPGLLRSFLFRSRKYAEAAVLHDAGYRGTLEEYVKGKWVKPKLSRKYVDERLLKDPAKCLGAPKTLQNALYWGVRAGGRRNFKG